MTQEQFVQLLNEKTPKMPLSYHQMFDNTLHSLNATEDTANEVKSSPISSEKSLEHVDSMKGSSRS